MAACSNDTSFYDILSRHMEIPKQVPPRDDSTCMKEYRQVSNIRRTLARN